MSISISISISFFKTYQLWKLHSHDRTILVENFKTGRRLITLLIILPRSNNSTKKDESDLTNHVNRLHTNNNINSLCKYGDIPARI